MAAFDVKAAFKYGFLQRCAEEGLGPEEAEKRAALALEKSAAEGEVGGFVDAGRNLAGTILGSLALGAAGTGALGGLLVHKMQEPTVDADEVRKSELIQTYNAYAQNARLKALAARARPPAKPSFARF